MKWSESFPLFAFASLVLASPLIARSNLHSPLHSLRTEPQSQRIARARLGRPSSFLASRGDAVDRALPAEILSSQKAVWIRKSSRRLIRYENGEPVKSYLIAIGRNETASKDAAGDWATPEGLYHVRKKNPQSRFHLALQIDYPNRDDAERGLADGIVSRSQYDAITTAVERGEMTPQDTRLGYYIEIHGGYNTVRKNSEGQPYLARWTRGCVGLRDVDIDEIYAWAPEGMPVYITP